MTCSSTSGCNTWSMPGSRTARFSTTAATSLRQDVPLARQACAVLGGNCGRLGRARKPRVVICSKYKLLTLSRACTSTLGSARRSHLSPRRRRLSSSRTSKPPSTHARARRAQAGCQAAECHCRRRGRQAAAATDAPTICHQLLRLTSHGLLASAQPMPPTPHQHRRQRRGTS